MDQECVIYLDVSRLIFFFCRFREDKSYRYMGEYLVFLLSWRKFRFTEKYWLIKFFDGGDDNDDGEKSEWNLIIIVQA